MASSSVASQYPIQKLPQQDKDDMSQTETTSHLLKHNQPKQTENFQTQPVQESVARFLNYNESSSEKIA